MEFNAQSYVNTLLINVYQDDIKLVKVSDNVLKHQAKAEAVEIALSPDWEKYNKTLILKQKGVVVSVSEKEWSVNLAKIPKVIDSDVKFEVKLLGFNGSEIQETEYLLIEIK